MKGSALTKAISNPTMAFTLNAGEGAGAGEFYARITSYDAIATPGTDCAPTIAPK